MRYLWEVVLAAVQEGIPLNKLDFSHSSRSAYIELGLECLNQTELGDIREISVNTYCRFYQIFKDIFEPEQREYPYLRKSLTNLMLHMLAENDARKGMTKEEYYKKMLLLDIDNRSFGEEVRQAFGLFQMEEQEKILSSWLRSYQSGSSLAIFMDMIRSLIEDSIVYCDNGGSNEILIYTRLKKSDCLERKIRFLIETFLEIQYQTEVFYEYHFGIIGIADTMILDEIAMY